MEQVLCTYSGSGRCRDKAGNEWVAEYEIDEIQEYVDTSSFSGPSTIEGLRRLEGVVVPVRAIGEEFILTSKEGTRFRLFHTSSSGAVAYMGTG